MCLEALPVDDRGARLIVLLLRDPHLLESRQRGEDGAPDPHGVLALGGGDDLDLHGRGSEGSDLLLHAVGDAAEHGGAAREHDVAVQVLTDVNVAFHDRVVGGLMDARRLKADERGLEENLGAAEALVADGDDLAVGKLVRLLDRRGLGGGLHLLLEVEGDVAKLLLDVADDLPLGGGLEGIAPLREDLHHVLRQVPARQVEAEDRVGEGEPLVDGHCMAHTVARVHDDARGPPGGVQGEHSLDRDVHSGHVESLKHDLRHLLPVGLGVEGRLSEEHGVLVRRYAELVVEGVRPDQLHLVPVAHDAVLDGVPEGEDAPLALRLVADVVLLLPHADHGVVEPRPAHQGGKYRTGCVVAGEPCLDHA
mmetsp:Transcript_59927/g.147314  ORF Transcript_59927/g.147314 Transcript_59927/m.147314 type:complete len:365 (+) Transcript_59927:412-1506(+)